jgi:hypothetical protein
MLVARLGGSNPAEPITISFGSESSPDRGREDYVAITYDCQQVLSQEGFRERKLSVTEADAAWRAP